MVLLRGAERSRRLAITLAVVGISAAQAQWPLAALESFAQRPVVAAQSLLLPLAAAACEVFVPPPPQASDEAPPVGLVDVERSSGQPAPVPAMEWLELPVLRVDEADGELRLGAGRDLHLAVDMPVAFGETYLGRIIDVEETRATVRLVQAADMRTGVYLSSGPEASAISAVAVGRRSSGQPLLALIDPKGVPLLGSAVLWRPSEEDGRAQDGPPLRLGALTQEGSLARGDRVWAISLDRPAGAEGRVYVLAGAVGDQLVAERQVESEEARRAISSDGVLGPNWPAVWGGDAPLGSIVCSGERVAGQIAVKRGELGWLRVRTARGWGREALAVSGNPAQIRAVVGGTELSEEAQLYSRGGGVVPRGLWLGPLSAPAAPLGAPLSVYADRTSVER